MTTVIGEFKAAVESDQYLRLLITPQQLRIGLRWCFYVLPTKLCKVRNTPMNRAYYSCSVKSLWRKRVVNRTLQVSWVVSTNRSSQEQCFCVTLRRRSTLKRRPLSP